jgi:hypothetical protein
MALCSLLTGRRRAPDRRISDRKKLTCSNKVFPLLPRIVAPRGAAAMRALVPPRQQWPITQSAGRLAASTRGVKYLRPRCDPRTPGQGGA